MKTLSKSWADRLAELRERCRESGERLDAELCEWYRRRHEGDWWAEFCRAAESGEYIPGPVWSSAEKLGARRVPGWVPRLRVRNRNRRGGLQ